MKAREIHDGRTKCPGCQVLGEVVVLSSSVLKMRRYRRRRCGCCGHRWSTFEISLEEFQVWERLKKLVRGERR